MNGLIQSLVDFLGSDKVYFKPYQLHAYCYDAMAIESEYPPLAVVFPTSTPEVSRVVRLCQEHGAAVVPRGAGTNCSAGTLTTRSNTVVVSLTRMNKVLGYWPERRMISVEAGLVNLKVSEIAAGEKLFFAPDPSSNRVSTIGGNVAENSGGAHCLKYGIMTDHVVSLKVVVSGGKIVELRRPWPYLNDGYDWCGLWVGSEGTLGIVTEVGLQLLPIPRVVETILAAFPDLDCAMEAVMGILSAHLLPTTLEVMDQSCVKVVEEFVHAGYPTDAGAVLIIEIDGRGDVGERAATVETITREKGAQLVLRASDEAQRNLLWLGRKSLYGACGSLSKVIYVQDITVPRGKLVAMMREVEDVANRYNLRVVTVAHAGDGNLHPTFAYDPANADELTRLHAADTEIVAAACRMNGSITGEHGIGLAKRDHMPLMWKPQELLLMSAVRDLVNSENIFNPDKVHKVEKPLPEISFTPENGAATMAVRPEFAPESEAEWVELVKWAAANKEQLLVTGTGTRTDIPPCPENHGQLVKTSRWSGIVDFDRDNLTITVRTGTRLNELEQIAAKEGLNISVDDEEGSDHTIGGSVCMNLSGPHGAGYRSWRHQVLGTRLLLPNGEVVRTGGKVVKNVAGLDLTKLLVGARGTLGVLLEVTLKLVPVPQSSLTTIVNLNDISQALELAHRLNKGLEASAVELLDLDLGMTKARVGVAVAIQMEGDYQDVAWMNKQLNAVLDELGAKETHSLQGAAETVFWEQRAALSRNKRQEMCSWQVMASDDTLPGLWDAIGHQDEVSLHGRLLAGNYRLHTAQNNASRIANLLQEFQVSWMPLTQLAAEFKNVTWGHDEWDLALRDSVDPGRLLASARLS